MKTGNPRLGCTRGWQPEWVTENSRFPVGYLLVSCTPFLCVGARPAGVTGMGEASACRIGDGSEEDAARARE